jgi:hypothetical protein
MEKMRYKLIAEGHMVPPEVFTPLSGFIESILIFGLILSRSRSAQTSIDFDLPGGTYRDKWIHEGTCALPKWGASTELGTTPLLERDSIINGVYKPRNLRSPPRSEYVCTSPRYPQVFWNHIIDYLANDSSVTMRGGYGPIAPPRVRLDIHSLIRTPSPH